MTFLRYSVHLIITIVHLYITATLLFKIYLTLGAVKFKESKLKKDYSHTYTILCPMYKEAEVLPSLIKNLSNLRYPQQRTNVFLILEEDDQSTRCAANNVRLPPNFKIVVVPQSYPGPKTKPRACNYALELVKSDLLVIYDAEDRPDPDQLALVSHMFISDRDLEIVQAELNWFNHEENFLTKFFTIEYTYWFSFLIKGFSELNLPFPLGGTSNHFRVKTLKILGGWNSYNVTEDCELGMRYASLKLKQRHLNSVTWEESVVTLSAWIKQRTRWLKGYMYTYINSKKSTTLGEFLVKNLFVLATPLISLLNPWLLLIFLLELTSNSLNVFTTFGSKLALFCFIAGYLGVVIFSAVATFKKGFKSIALLSFLLPFYWILHSVAAYRALYQLITDPHKWEKTEHGKSKINS